MTAPLDLEAIEAAARAPMMFSQRGRGDVLDLIAEVRRLREERQGLREDVVYVGASCDRELTIDGVSLRAARLSPTRHVVERLTRARDEAIAALNESEETARQASTRAEETVALLRTSIADLVPLRVAVREYLAARKGVTEVRHADESVAAHERVAAAFAMLGRLV